MHVQDAPPLAASPADGELLRLAVCRLVVAILDHTRGRPVDEALLLLDGAAGIFEKLLKEDAHER